MRGLDRVKTRRPYKPCVFVFYSCLFIIFTIGHVRNVLLGSDTLQVHVYDVLLEDMLWSTTRRHVYSVWLVKHRPLQVLQPMLLVLHAVSTRMPIWLEPRHVLIATVPLEE